jgi:hypothetical protein
MTPFEELNLTRQFQKSYGDLETRLQEQCEKALRFLLEARDHPGLGVKPILPGKIYWEARINRSDRLVFRPEGSTAHIIDVVEHDDIERWG